MAKILTKREKIIAALTIFTIAVSLGLHFFVLPLVNRNERLNKEIIASKAKLQRYLKLLNQKEYLENQFGGASEESSGEGNNKDTLVNVLLELENTAKKSNVKIVDIRPQLQKTQGAITIDVRTEAVMDDYVKFIYELESTLFLLEIRRLQLTVRPQAKGIEGNFSILLEPVGE